MVVRTEDEEIAGVRRTILELVLSEHCASCTTCDRDGTCRLQDYAYRYRADEHRFGAAAPKASRANYASNNKAILFDADKCIRCGLCVKYCEEVQMAAIGLLIAAGAVVFAVALRRFRLATGLMWSVAIVAALFHFAETLRIIVRVVLNHLL